MKKKPIFCWTVATYIIILACLIIFAPFTGGRSLGGICFLGGAAFVHGLGYIIWDDIKVSSGNKNG